MKKIINYGGRLVGYETIMKKIRNYLGRLVGFEKLIKYFFAVAYE